MRFLFSLFFLLLLASGCSSMPEQTFNPEQYAVNTIAVAKPYYDEDLLLRYRHDQVETIDAISPVPIGKLFAYVATANREAEFTQKSSTPTDLFAKTFHAQLENQLKEDQFTVVTALLPTGSDVRRKRNGLRKSIPANAFEGVDALLETSGQIGFSSAGRGKPFEPTVWLSVRLIKPTGKVLLQDQILLNPPVKDVRGFAIYPQGISLYPSGDYLFENEEAILNSPDTLNAFTQATKRVARELSLLLKGQVQYVR